MPGMAHFFIVTPYLRAADTLSGLKIDISRPFARNGGRIQRMRAILEAQPLPVLPVQRKKSADDGLFFV